MNKQAIGTLLLILSYPVAFFGGVIVNEMDLVYEEPAKLCPKPVTLEDGRTFFPQCKIAPFTQEALGTYTAEKIDKEWCRSRLNGEWFILPDDFKKCISDYPEFNVDYKYYLGKLEFKIPVEKKEVCPMIEGRRDHRAPCYVPETITVTVDTIPDQKPLEYPLKSEHWKIKSTVIKTDGEITKDALSLNYCTKYTHHVGCFWSGLVSIDNLNTADLKELYQLLKSKYE